MEFIDYCNCHKILLVVLPSHSTHMLQSLDVVLFKPLSQSYSQSLTLHLYKDQGLVTIKKKDFFSHVLGGLGVLLQDYLYLKVLQSDSIRG
jgi:hypothetical protein